MYLVPSVSKAVVKDGRGSFNLQRPVKRKYTYAIIEELPCEYEEIILLQISYQLKDTNSMQKLNIYILVFCIEFGKKIFLVISLAILLCN